MWKAHPRVRVVRIVVVLAITVPVNNFNGPQIPRQDHVNPKLETVSGAWNGMLDSPTANAPRGDAGIRLRLHRVNFHSRASK